MDSDELILREMEGEMDRRIIRFMKSTRFMLLMLLTVVALMVYMLQYYSASIGGHGEELENPKNDTLRIFKISVLRGHPNVEFLGEFDNLYQMKDGSQTVIQGQLLIFRQKSK